MFFNCCKFTTQLRLLIGYLLYIKFEIYKKNKKYQEPDEKKSYIYVFFKGILRRTGFILNELDVKDYSTNTVPACKSVKKLVCVDCSNQGIIKRLVLICCKLYYANQALYHTERLKTCSKSLLVQNDIDFSGKATNNHINNIRETGKTCSSISTATSVMCLRSGDW